MPSAPRNYHWVFEADIAACFDEIRHSAVMDRVRRRIADKRVLALIKAFLKAGIMSADGKIRDSDHRHPQGGIISPLLANIALSVLDEHFRAKWDAHRTSQRRDAHRKRGGATYRIVRYADDFVIMVAGTKAHADALWDEVAEVYSPPGAAPVRREDPGMSPRRGVRLPRVPHPAAPERREPTSSSVYTYPSKKALLSIMAKVRALTRKAQHHGLADLLGRLNRFCADGARTSATACLKRPSGTSIPMPGTGSPSGCSSGTSESRGRNSTGGS